MQGLMKKWQGFELALVAQITLLIVAISYFMIRVVLADGTAVADPNSDFLNQVFTLIKSFGGLPWIAKISAILVIVISSMKVSFLQPFWAKIGPAQVFVAPILGIVVGVASMNPITWQGVVAYMFAGAGAILLHQLLDSVKGLPGIGTLWISVIDFIEKLPIFGAKS